MLILRSWKARVALGAAIAITGSALGLYLAFRPHSVPAPQPKVAAPPVVTVGSTTVSDPAAAVNLLVVKTSPASKAAHIDPGSSITITFNLAVDPAVVENSFTMLPATEGTFDQGNADTVVVFTPNDGFDFGQSIKVVVHKGLTSIGGSVLQNDFSFGFVTAVGASGVVFQSEEEVGRLLNAPPGSIDVSVQIGDDVPSDVAVQTFKATSADLVQALVHNSDGKYVKKPIVTKTMKAVTTKMPVKNGDTIKVAQPDGIYVVLVSDAKGQYGSVWVSFSKFGVILRQDDQKIVVAGEDISTGDATPQFAISFYKLLDSVQKVLSGSFTRTAEFPAAYPAGIDLAVASSGGEEVVIPMEAPETNADIKVMGNLAQQAAVFLTTDRAGYLNGETVKYAGVFRFNNDQAYAIPSASNVIVSIGDDPIFLKQTVALAPDGTFSGSFPIPAGAFSKDGSDAQLSISASVAGANPMLNGTVVQALGARKPSGKLTVTFDKPSYLLGDTVVASIVGTDNSGQPLAGKSVSLDLYTNQRPASPNEISTYPVPSSLGDPTNEEPITLQLDATGHAKYSFPGNSVQQAADQQLTVVVTYGSGAAAAIVARSTVVYQATDEVFLLPSRWVYAVGETMSAPFVVETSAGERIANATLAYELDQTDQQGDQDVTTVVSSGTVTTGADGRGTITTVYSGSADSLTLVAKGKDTGGNVFQDSKYLTIVKAGSQLSGYNGTDSLIQLGVTTDKIDYNVGDKAQLTITSPAPLTVLMAAERGRIHQYRLVTLAKGDNQVSIDMSPDLAPGFTLVFAYIQKAAYITEGLPIYVTDPTRLLNVTVTPDQASYAAGQTAHLKIAIKDGAGNPVAATVFVDGYDASMSDFKLTDQWSIASAFWVPDVRATNGSSSLVGIGTYGGMCGGGPGGSDTVMTVPGQLAIWLPAVTTDATGQATVDVPMASKKVRLAVIASTPSTAVGQAELDLAVR